MTLIPLDSKINTISANQDTREKRSALINGKSEYYTLQDLKETVGGGSDIPVLTTYPTTDASKVGQKFIYKGVEWSYMSQAEINALGWDAVEGFPAPVQKNFNPFLLTDSDEYRAANGTVSVTNVPVDEYGKNVVIDFLGLGDPTRFNEVHFGFSYNSVVITEFKNVNLLTNLKSASGTSNSILLISTGLTDTVINQLFTDLPPTSNTVNINVSSNPGSGTCDPTIATSKGYTVQV